MPQTFVLLEHDDGRTYQAVVLAQYRVAGRWRALVRYTVATGMQYERAKWANEMRPA